jgi:EpsI family protein
MKSKRSHSAGFLPLALAFALTAAIAWEVGRRPTPADAEPFHHAAAAAIGDLPIHIGNWEGSDVPVPTAARTLLKPNALMCRQYRNKDTGEQASLVLVQCRDTRDMGGHYPPICYPGQGWIQEGSGQRVPIPLGDRTIPVVRYEFHREAFDRDRQLVVYNFFAIPGQGLPIDMEAIRKVAADYTARPFGAAQIQVVFEGRRSLEEERAVLSELLRPMEPVVGLLSDGKWRSR